MPKKTPPKKSQKNPKKNPKISKYALYELSVQSPKAHAASFVSMYKELCGKYPQRLREDFCGTFSLACEWVKRNKRNTATGIDLDEEPLAYGKRTHRARLSKEQKTRLKILQQDVRTITSPKVDLIAACNFSFYIFKSRKELISYFSGCLRSLRTHGLLLLEMAGGPGMIRKMRESKKIRYRTPGGPSKEFTYIWDQKSFDPITHDARYSIHFKFPSGARLQNAFTYDWRLWTIPEIRDVLREAGFKETYVYWESEFEGKGTGEFVKSTHGDNAYSWIAYVVAKRCPATF